jgi:hypothetical protein
MWTEVSWPNWIHNPGISPNKMRKAMKHLRIVRAPTGIRINHFPHTNPNPRNSVFWDVAPCRSCVNRRFGGTYRLHLACSHLLTLVPLSRIYLPWRWRRYVPPKHRLTQDLHGATSQKMAFFIVTAVRNLNSYKSHPTEPIYSIYENIILLLYVIHV